MFFEVVVRSLTTGGIWYTTGGFYDEESAKEEAEAIEREYGEEYWCEIRTQRS